MNNRQLDKLVRKLNNVERHGGNLTFPKVTRQLYDSGYTVLQIQAVVLTLFNVYKSRRQISRVIRAYTKQSTKNLI